MDRLFMTGWKRCPAWESSVAFWLITEISSTAPQFALSYSCKAVVAIDGKGSGNTHFVFEAVPFRILSMSPSLRICAVSGDISVMLDSAFKVLSSSRYSSSVSTLAVRVGGSCVSCNAKWQSLRRVLYP